MSLSRSLPVLVAQTDGTRLTAFTTLEQPAWSIVIGPRDCPATELDVYDDVILTLSYSFCDR